MRNVLTSKLPKKKEEEEEKYHLDYIGEDGYVYKHNGEKYYKTGIFLQGPKGLPGVKGKDGLIPRIGENGNWFIGDTDTFVKAALDTSLYATKKDLDDLIDNAPEVLNTLKELANAIGDDADFATNVNNRLTDIENVAYQVPVGGIPESDLSQEVKDKINEKEVFWATYGTTTAAEIDAAVAAGKVVMCYYQYHIYRLEDCRNDMPLYFSCFIASQIRYYLTVNRTTSVWGSSYISHEILSNKVSSWSATPNNTHYPSEKLVKESLDTKAGIGDVEALQQADTNLQGQIAAETTRATSAENAIKGGSEKSIQNLDNRLNMVEQLAEISVEGGTISIASSEDFTNRTPAGDAKIPTVGAVLGGADDVPTAGSNNLVKSGGVQNELALGAVYDVSAKNPTAGPNNDGKWESLSALLSDANLNTLIPSAFRRGGMSIKFVLSSDNKYIRYNLLANSFTTDTTQWAIDDAGVYVENPEYVDVKTDKDGRVLWAIEKNGNIHFGAGVPQQVIDYVTEKISELSLDEYEDIVAFLDELINKQPIFYNKRVSIIGDSISTYAGYILSGYNTWYPHENDRSSDVVSVNDTWWKKLIDATNSTLEVNASWSGSRVTTLANVPNFADRVNVIGSPDIIIIALGTNDSSNNVEIGNINFNAESYDLTKFAPAYIKGIQDTIAIHPYARIICIAFDMGVAYQNAIKTIAGHYGIEYIYVGDISDVHPNKAEMQNVFDRIYNTWTLSGLLCNKVEKENGKSLIPTQYIQEKENPEFIDALIDNNGKLLEGIRTDGTKVFGSGIKIHGKQEIDGVEYTVVTNPEWVIAWIDRDNKILFGAKHDGKFYVYDADFLNAIKVNEEAIAYIKETIDIDEIDWDCLKVFSDVSDYEYINAELDADGKLISGRKKDGTKHELIGIETPCGNIGGALYKGYNDFSERIEIKTDSNGRIISYRDKDGVLHEEVGLSLSKQGMTAFQKALTDNGFISGGKDFSNTEAVELPEPKHYSILNLVVSKLPLADNEVIDGFAEYYDFFGNYFRKAIKLESQGQTSKTFARTGGKGNYTIDLDDGSEIKFGSWVPQDSFHLKGCAKDVTRAILPTSYKLAWKVMNYLDAKPNRVLMNESAITTTAATGNRITDWPDDARCLPDGFPVEIYVNGEYWGLYSWQLKKHRKNYSMGKKDYKSFFIDADALMSESYDDGFWLGDIWWTRFEIKNPKDLICMDGSAYDGDHPKELIDETAVGIYDATNKKHKGSKQTKDIIKSFSTKYLEIRDAMYEEATNGAYKKDVNGNFVPYNSPKATGDTRYDLKSDLSSQKALFAEYFDINACMLVYIFNCTMGNGDSIMKNTLWGTYSDGKIAPFLWDLDAMYGTGWIGYIASSPSASLWTGDYATAAWPLALFWTLYEVEIKAAYANLRREGIINMETWKSVMYDSWINRIGKEAYERDIEKWSETPSYRENYTNTEYWHQDGRIYDMQGYSLWDENETYTVGSSVLLYMNAEHNYMKYTAIQGNTGVCPVTKLYEQFPSVGGYYDSPKRMEKWMAAQIALCDALLGYSE